MYLFMYTNLLKRKLKFQNQQLLLPLKIKRYNWTLGLYTKLLGKLKYVKMNLSCKSKIQFTISREEDRKQKKIWGKVDVRNLKLDRKAKETAKNIR